MTDDVQAFIAERLSDPATSWNMGSFGAIAEFHRDHDEPVGPADDPRDLAVATERGAIRFDPSSLRSLELVAYEGVGRRPDGWTQALVFCLPEEAARRSARRVLSELGPDREAVRERDRGDTLFDMGLGLPQCDFCVRASGAVATAIRASVDHALFSPEGKPALDAIFGANPHRVAITNVGRVEVYQKIGGPVTGGASPQGPHTHLLPTLLKSGRTHAATTPVPDGHLPCGGLHPPSAVTGALGERIPFDLDRHKAFQDLIARFGTASGRAIKDAVARALALGTDPAGFPEPGDRIARLALRATLRQAMQIAQAAGDASACRAVDQWLARFDHGGRDMDDADH